MIVALLVFLGIIYGWVMLCSYFKIHPVYSKAEQFSFPKISVIIIVASFAIAPVAVLGHISRMFLIIPMVIWILLTIETAVAYIVVHIGKKEQKMSEQIKKLEAENAELRKSVDEAVGYVHESMRMAQNLANQLPDTDAQKADIIKRAQTVIDKFVYIPFDHPDASEAIKYRETIETENGRLKERIRELEEKVEELS